MVVSGFFFASVLSKGFCYCTCPTVVLFSVSRGDNERKMCRFSQHLLCEEQTIKFSRANFRKHFVQRNFDGKLIKYFTRAVGTSPLTTCNTKHWQTMENITYFYCVF